MIDIDDHSFNRIVAGLDLVAFPLIAQEVISLEALAGLQGASRRLSRRIDMLLPKVFRRTDKVMALISLIMLPLTFYIFPYRMDAGPLWLTRSMWFLGGIVFAIVGFIAFSDLLNAFARLTANMADRRKVFWIGAFLFAVARVLVLAHG